MKLQGAHLDWKSILVTYLVLIGMCYAFYDIMGVSFWISATTITGVYIVIILGIVLGFFTPGEYLESTSIPEKHLLKTADQLIEKQYGNAIDEYGRKQTDRLRHILKFIPLNKHYTEMKVVALLRNIISDYPDHYNRRTIEKLFNKDIADAVWACTWYPNISTDEYIKRITENEISLEVMILAFKYDRLDFSRFTPETFKKELNKPKSITLVLAFEIEAYNTLINATNNPEKYR